MNGDVKEKQIQNALIYSVSPEFLSEHNSWALGYGLRKYFFNRSTAPGYHKLNYFAFGIDLLHINHERKKFTRSLSLLSRPHVTFGSRLHPKNKRYYFFASMAYNIYRSSDDRVLSSLFKEAVGKEEGFQQSPGFAAGVLVQ